MAEVVFGAVSAGIGVAAAAGQLIDGIMKLYSFCSQIRDIPGDIQTAVEDLSTLVEVLEFIQIEMSNGTLPSNGPMVVKVLSSLQQSSRQVGEVLRDMQLKLGKKRYWSRVKVVGMKEKLEKAAKRVDSAQRLVLMLLAAETRMVVRQRNLTSSSSDSDSSTMSNLRAIEDIQNSDSTDDDHSTARTTRSRHIQQIPKSRAHNTSTVQLKVPTFVRSMVWEFYFHRASQGWDFSLRSYNVRPWNAQIFQAIAQGDISQVIQMLDTGRASLWDQDPSGSALLHHAAVSCRRHGPEILEYLVKKGADIHAVDHSGWQPAFLLHDKYNSPDEQKDQRLVAGFKVLASHPDWIAPRPSAKMPFQIGETDTFSIFQDPPLEITRSILKEMWPPWEGIPPAERVRNLFPEERISNYSFRVYPRSVREFISRQCIQETFAGWAVEDRAMLVWYTFGALAEQMALGSEKRINEAREFLRDMHKTKSLVGTMPEVDTLCDFVDWYAFKKLSELRDQQILPGEEGPLEIQKHLNLVEEGFRHYISELMLLGIDMATVIDVENRVRARHWPRRIRKTIFTRPYTICYYRVIAIDYGLNVEDWRLWLSNPLEEWAGSFWELIDDPGRAVPGAWRDWDNDLDGVRVED